MWHVCHVNLPPIRHPVAYPVPALVSRRHSNGATGVWNRS